MSALESDEVRIEALFVSDLQRSQQPTPELIRQAVTATVGRLGEIRCAELVAQEFGEHPDCAPGRMQWARTEVRRAFDNA
jgi:choline dehydrogenase-like flavoprotein